MTCSELIEKAGLAHMAVSGKKYHSPLPKELEQFYCYMQDGGHCILVLLPGCKNRPVEDYIIPAPVKAVLRRGYTVQDGYVVCDLPYSESLGLTCAKDDEYDTNEGIEDGIVVSNNGKLIESTNYWQSSYAKNGVYYFTINAGCIRLLVPSSPATPFGDDVLKGTQYVIITRGQYQGRDAYEILFEDGSDSPFVIFTGANQWERAIPKSEAGRTDLGFDVYKNGQRVREMTARFRAVAHLPCLKPWK
jgi:hypothetical protein